MRKILLGLGASTALALGFMLLTPAAPAYAATGCSCGSLNKKPVCVPTFVECNFQAGGVCTGFCDLPDKKMRKGKRKKKK